MKKTIIIGIVIMILLFTFGCKKQENELEETVVIPTGVKDTSVLDSKLLHDAAIAETDINNALAKCNELAVDTIRKDWCMNDISKKAVTSETALEICNIISDSATKDDCLRNSALRLGDDSLCSSISDKELNDLCIGQSSGSCDAILDEQDKEMCLEQVSS